MNRRRPAPKTAARYAACSATFLMMAPVKLKMWASSPKSTSSFKGAFSGNTLLTQKLDDLTRQRELYEEELSRLEIEKPLVPRELIVSWLDSFRAGDVSDPTVRKRIVKNFVGAIILTNEEIDIIYNVSDTKKARDPKEIAGSYRVSRVDPRGLEPGTCRL